MGQASRRGIALCGLVGTVHAHDTPLAPHLAGLRVGFTSSSQKHQGWPLQLAGLIEPPSTYCQWPPPPTWHPPASPGEPKCHPLDPQVPISILPSGNNPPRSLAALSKWIWTYNEDVLNAAALWDTMLPDHAWSSWIEYGWLDFCFQRNFKLTEIGVDSPFPLLRDAWATGRKKYWILLKPCLGTLSVPLYFPYELLYIQAQDAFSKFEIQILLQQRKGAEIARLQCRLRTTLTLVVHPFSLLCLDMKFGWWKILSLNWAPSSATGK